MLAMRLRQQGYTVTECADGAELLEQLGGYFLIDVKDLDEAIDIASRVPAGRWGTVEIRPIVEVPSLPLV